MPPDTGRDGRWAEQPDAIALALHELPAYCLRQRWYPAKDAAMPVIALDTLIPLKGCSDAAALAVWKIAVEGRASFALFIPLAVVSKGGYSGSPAAVVGQLPHGQLLIDALASDSFIRAFVGLMLEEAGSRSNAVQTGRTERLAALREISAAQWRIKRSSVEQSNTSIRIADGSILKVIRKVAPGIHPELEMTRFLTEKAHFPSTPALLGWVNLGDMTVAILQNFISNEGDGWTWVRARLEAGAEESEKARRWLATLGRRTAEMHLALDTPNADAEFQAETAQRQDWERWLRDLAAMAARVRDALEANQSKLDNETRRLISEFKKCADSSNDLLASLISGIPQWRKTRHHGDFHLGQTLVSGDDAIIVDFEGEPLRSLSERRAKHVPLRDVAGMLRSVQYATATLEREQSAGWTSDERSKEVERLNKWAADASRTLMESYLDCLSENSTQPMDTKAATDIVQFFLLEKALYEVLYELANRPSWTSIPLQSAVSLFAQLKAAGGVSNSKSET